MDFKSHMECIILYINLQIVFHHMTGGNKIKASCFQREIKILIFPPHVTDTAAVAAAYKDKDVVRKGTDPVKRELFLPENMQNRCIGKIEFLQKGTVLNMVDHFFTYSRIILVINSC